ncbi:Hypothetical predicted protein [Octopus vulgaris]|uniref:Uncharacterized protein n=1 Tax=Octopus vulgaris TaxID=6645 RepID=A0AA36FH30_OCTVU|nr:Hypothetical predicted protein [Octopus vulgaris]
MVVDVGGCGGWLLWGGCGRCGGGGGGDGGFINDCCGRAERWCTTIFRITICRGGSDAGGGGSSDEGDCGCGGGCDGACDGGGCSGDVNGGLGGRADIHSLYFRVYLSPSP